MKFTSKVCTVEKSCQVRRVKAVQDLSIRLGHGAEDAITGKLSSSSGEEIACGNRASFCSHRLARKSVRFPLGR